MPLCCPKCTFILSPSDDSLEQSYVCNSCQSGPFTKCDQCDTLFLICRRLSWKLKRHASNVHKDIHRDDSQPIDQNELDEDKSIHSQQFDRSHHAHTFTTTSSVIDSVSACDAVPHNTFSAYDESELPITNQTEETLLDQFSNQCSDLIETSEHMTENDTKPTSDDVLVTTFQQYHQVSFNNLFQSFNLL